MSGGGKKPPTDCAAGGCRLAVCQRWFFFSHGPDVVCRQQAALPRALVASKHPSGVNWLHIEDQISFLEWNLICFCCLVAVHGLVSILRRKTQSWSKLRWIWQQKKLNLYTNTAKTKDYEFPTKIKICLALQTSKNMLQSSQKECGHSVFIIASHPHCI